MLGTEFAHRNFSTLTRHLRSPGAPCRPALFFVQPCRTISLCSMVPWFPGSLVPWLSVTSASRQTDLQSSCQLCLKRNNPDASQRAMSRKQKEAERLKTTAPLLVKSIQLYSIVASAT